MSIVQYKNYQGSVTFQDGRLSIRILHIDDFISTECEKASEVQAAFEELVDDYIYTCEELGQAPNKPFKGSFNVRVSPELHRLAAIAAVERGESLNAWVTKALEERLDREKVLSDPSRILRVAETQTSNAPYIRRRSRNVTSSRMSQAAPFFEQGAAHMPTTFTRSQPREKQN